MKDHLGNLEDVPEVQELAKLQAQMQRPARQANIDGGFELGWGMAVICFGLGPYFIAMLPKSVWVSAWSSWLGYVPLLCACFAPYALPKMVKRYVTWPRIGYVVTPHEMKLGQLIRIMIFGSALGYSLSMPFIIFTELRNRYIPGAFQTDSQTIFWQSAKLVICVVVTVYLGRKVVTKRQPLPSAYDATFVRELKQTAGGRWRLRMVRSVLFALFVGVPLLLFGAVLGLMYLSKTSLRHLEIDWSQLGMASILVASNAALYLMGNGLAMMQHKWKWLIVGLIIIGPVLVAPLIPYPVESALTRAFEASPPIMLCLGMVWFISGAATLMLFMRDHPVGAVEMA